VIGMRHFAMGATTMIEDYARGTARKLLIIFALNLAGLDDRRGGLSRF
jgi:succinate dehydrogenase / fumarate reductase membrane anchor subunit